MGSMHGVIRGNGVFVVQPRSAGALVFAQACPPRPLAYGD